MHQGSHISSICKVYHPGQHLLLQKYVSPAEVHQIKTHIQPLQYWVHMKKNIYKAMKYSQKVL